MAKKINNLISGKRTMVVVEVSPLTLCNKRCDHCFIPKELLSDPSVLEIDDVNHVLNTVKNFIDKVSVDIDRTLSFDITLLGGELLLMPLQNNLDLIEAADGMVDYFYNHDSFETSESQYLTNLIFPKSKNDNFEAILNKIEGVNDFRGRSAIRTCSSFEPDTGRFPRSSDLNLFIENSKKTRNRNIKNFVIATTTSGLTKINPLSLEVLFKNVCGFDEVVYDMFHSFGSGKEKEHLHPDWKQYNNFLLTYMANDTLIKDIDGFPENIGDYFGGSFVEGKVGVPLVFISLSSEGCSFVFNDNVECSFKGSVSLEDIMSLSNEDATNLLYSKWEEYLRIIYKRTFKINNCLGCDIVEYCQSGFYGNVYGFGNEHKVKEMFADKFDRCPIYDGLKSLVDPLVIKSFSENNNFNYDRFFKINSVDFKDKGVQYIYDKFINNSRVKDNILNRSRQGQ